VIGPTAPVDYAVQEPVIVSLKMSLQQAFAPFLALVIGVAPSCGAGSSPPATPSTHSASPATPSTSSASAAGAHPCLSKLTKEASRSVNKDDLQDVMSVNMGQIDECRLQAVKEWPDMPAGKIVVAFMVETDGTVSESAIVMTSLHDGCLLEECVARTVKKWVVANRSGGRAVARCGFGFTPPE